MDDSAPDPDPGPAGESPDQVPPQRLGYTREDKIWTYVLFSGGGIALFVLAPIVAAWLAEHDLPFVPFGDVLEWVGGFDQWWAWIARPVLGALLAVVIAAIMIDEAWSLEVHDDHVLTVRGRDRRRLPRDEIVGIHLERKRVVIDGHEGRVLFDKEVEAKRDAVRSAFVSRGYPYENE